MPIWTPAALRQIVRKPTTHQVLALRVGAHAFDLLAGGGFANDLHPRKIWQATRPACRRILAKVYTAGGHCARSFPPALRMVTKSIATRGSSSTIRTRAGGQAGLALGNCCAAPVRCELKYCGNNDFRARERLRSLLNFNDGCGGSSHVWAPAHPHMKEQTVRELRGRR